MTDSKYKELVQLHENLSEGGLEIVAFPCNQFGKQEPGTAEEIQATLDKYGVKFRVMEKVDVNGPGAHPVFRLLKGEEGNEIRWNFFSQFLVHCPGDVCKIYRYDGFPKPNQVEPHVVQCLQETQEL